VIVSLAVLVQYRRVTDGRTDGRTRRQHIPRQHSVARWKPFSNRKHRKISLAGTRIRLWSICGTRQPTADYWNCASFW